MAVMNSLDDVAEKAEISCRDDRGQKISFKKIGSAEGSNPGGWYQDVNSRQFYFKFYPNEDNARIEFVANAIYRKLGIYAPDSRLLKAENGVLAIISPKLSGARRTTKEEQKTNPDILSGFVVDCYLNNWDVVGEFFDNIIYADDGHMYRIDNGGCGPLRAQGKEKSFLDRDIPELEDMRNPKFQAGEIFENISEAEIKSQAKKLVEILKPEMITKLVKESGLTGRIKEKVENGLIGRLSFLKSKITFFPMKLSGFII